MARKARKHQSLLTGDTKRVELFVLFVPSADRQGDPLPDQQDWVDQAIRVFAQRFGGATAMPPCQGGWLDPKNKKLVVEKPVLVHSYAKTEDVERTENLVAIRDFCHRMGKQTRQGEIALVIGDVMHSWYFD